MKKYLLPLILSLLSLSSLAQNGDTTYLMILEKTSIENPTRAVFPKTIHGKVWLNDGQKPIKGEIKAVNDSTLRVGRTVVATKEIEKIKIKNTVASNLGGGLMVFGAVTTAAGSLILFHAYDQEGAIVQFVNIFFGKTVITVGAGITVIGLLIASVNQQSFDMDKWNFQITPDRIKTQEN